MAATKHAQQIKQDSQEYLTTALLQLLENKDLAEITIAQVVRRAGVSRMAFYRNFETLSDVLTAYFKPQIDARFNDIMTNTPQDQKIAALGQFFTDMTDTFNLAAKRGFEPIIQTVFNENMATFYKETINWNDISVAQQTYWVKFMSAGVYAIWREWLSNGQKESIEAIHEILAMFQQSTLAALKE
ncbi:MAG: TetR/AcrR family transcriptional regulator [Furfurilactobacillus sp.]|jgi:AcrR family transcriptional regulator|uniref:TetR/AcrR family transcriptional regulator n=2 Tax=Furfurilactobacillus TaxID=2767882 RepID=A0ABT6DB57_9LACO|nr:MULTISPECIES: TetR/AcrR family transcriptional regulator [Furfurilactobacillus]QLE65431.1 Transcriptional regulator TetR [Furfurilactobacillus rossiae]MCF6160929.1 TetR/AcrR family transcriptional regulator [Furfurilactobacillus milii]MCF6163305.1 TetR/AcrR family transcriptional regulator [Furfurilactobacillus milii]MCH4011939.1 TetR/AcrR family transcriptional regulator [Furfurilactobacillus sp.]MCH4037831.1 TetR/AcrR family transcriptional regulator [Furfurilactobacillus sp.]